MLQAHMMIVRPNRTATATYKADSDEVNTNSKVYCRQQGRVCPKYKNGDAECFGGL